MHKLCCRSVFTGLSKRLHELRRRTVLRGGVDGLHELLSWKLCGGGWRVCLHGLHRWKLLRDDRAHGGYGRMRGGEICGR